MFSLLELINLNTISLEAAAYLCFLLFHKRNIIVIGAPGAGKTTLINSLDIMTPPKWRKIYLEDVIESTSQANFGRHQVRFHVSISSEKDEMFSKSYQVRETLHRTPDMIFIGELIHKETVKAFFFLLKSGIRCGLATCHGESPELIIQRWIEDDEIPKNSIENVDAIVQIAKTKFGRRVIRISEIEMNKEYPTNFKIKNIFLRDPENDTLKLENESFDDLFHESPVLNKIKRLLIESISIKAFSDELNAYISFFKQLKNHKIHNFEEFISYINKFWGLKTKLEKRNSSSFTELTRNLISIFP